VSYRLEGGRCTLEHTFVPDALRGQGVAAALVAAALDEARRRGWTIVPACSYVAAFLQRRAEYNDLLDPEWQATDRG